MNLANSTVMRRDAVLGALRPGARKDTVAALHSSPIQADLLFPEAAMRQAEQEMKEFDAARQRDRNPHPSHTQGAPRSRPHQSGPTQSQGSQHPKRKSLSAGPPETQASRGIPAEEKSQR